MLYAQYLENTIEIEKLTYLIYLTSNTPRLRKTKFYITKKHHLEAAQSSSKIQSINKYLLE